MRNHSYVKEAFSRFCVFCLISRIYDVVEITSGEDDGIKIDHSFFQHGPQVLNTNNRKLYSGGYGQDFSAQLFQILHLSVNTSLEISASKLKIFADLVLQGQQWMIAYPYLFWDINVKGRHILYFL